MCRVTVRAFAGLIHSPIYAQLRILREQKFPKEAPGIFKVGYYNSALGHISKYYRTGDESHLPPTEAGLIGAGNNEHKMKHNLRVISTFRKSDQFDRELTILKKEGYGENFGKLEVRATPDLYVQEEGDEKYLLYDCRCDPLDLETVRSTVELFHYILEQNDIECPMKNIEYVCVEENEVLTWKSRRKTTIERAKDTGNAIAALWDTIE